MITTRERIKISEIFKGIISAILHYDQKGIEHYIPLEKRYFILTNKGKTAFEQIVIAAKLENSKILLPAFFPNDFVGIFLKHNITPVFIDVEPDTYHLDLEVIDIKQLEGAKSMLLLHTFGLPANGNKFKTYCEEHNLILIEDCARALGASFRGNLVGSFGQYAMFSLPKCTPVRQGGIALSEKPLAPSLQKPKIGLHGLLNQLALVKYPFLSLLESPIYKLVSDTPIYPGEVGNFEALPGREFDNLGRFILKCFIPNYNEAKKLKLEIAMVIKRELESSGFKFQKNNGNHIYNELSVEPPLDCDSDELGKFLKKKGVKVGFCWRDALGVSTFSQKTWNIIPEQTPIALRLSKRLIQIPISRFQANKQTIKIINLCKRFISNNNSF